MTPSQKSTLAAELLRATQLGYLAAAATSMILEADPRTVSGTLSRRIKSLAQDGRPVRATAMSPRDIKKRRSELPGFVVDLLLLHLLSVCHFRLAAAAGCSETDEAPRVEELVRELSGTSGVHQRKWWYRELVLLAEIRNAIAHGSGKVALPIGRLIASGWTTEELKADERLRQRSFATVLGFKRVVRTALNQMAPRWLLSSTSIMGT